MAAMAYGELIHDSELINSYVSINFLILQTKAVDLADSVAWCHTIKLGSNLADWGLGLLY